MSERRFRSIWQEVDGVQMHAVSGTERLGGRPPIVLVHGLGLSRCYMMPTAEALAARYQVYVPDLPGFGESDKPKHVLRVPELADALAGWMKAVGIGETYLLGNSFGCQIIGELMARYPDCTSGAVLQGPTTPPEERTWFWQWLRWRQNNRYNPPSIDQVTKDDYRKAGYKRVLLTFRHSLFDGLEKKLPHIRAPVLVVRGRYDPIANERWVERLTGDLPDGRLVLIPGVAHTLVYTAPEQLAAVTAQFIDEQRYRK